MNLTKLFEAQRVLDERIEQKHPRVKGENRLESKSLALQVELGECANEWRGFKFWSKDQTPRTKVPVTLWGEPYRNPLLEELVDVFHFALSIGNDMKRERNYVPPLYTGYIPKPIDAFSRLFFYTTKIRGQYTESVYELLLDSYFILVYSLGFTRDEIETAYYEKNKINHERQDANY